MSTPYSPDKNGKRISGYAPSFSRDPMFGFSAVQDDSSNISMGIATSTSVGTAIIDRIVMGVIGKGLSPMSAPEKSLLNWTDKQAKRFQDEAETFWRLYSSSDKFDWYGKNNFSQIQQIALRDILIYGDCLLHRGYRRKNNSVTPFVQLIAGNMVRNSNYIDSKRNRGGVLFHENSDIESGYEIAVIAENLMDTFSTKAVQRFNSNGFKEFDLISLKNLSEKATRGIPLLNPVRGDILMLEKIKNNYLVKMSVQNIFALFLKKTSDAPDNGASLNEKLMGLDLGQGIESEEERKIDLGPGVIIDGERGEEAQILQAATQSADFAQMVKTLLENISSACYGLPYEVLLSSFNSSFSASRASINIAEKSFSAIRSEFVSKFNTPVWDMVIDYGIRIGMVHAPGYTFGKNEFIDKAILASTWTGVTPVQVDPVKEVNAYTTALNAGLCTREFAIRNLYGLDAEEVFERMAKEKRYMEELGLGEQPASAKGDIDDEEE